MNYDGFISILRSVQAHQWALSYSCDLVGMGPRCWHVYIYIYMKMLYIHIYICSIPNVSRIHGVSLYHQFMAILSGFIGLMCQNPVLPWFACQKQLHSIPDPPLVFSGSCEAQIWAHHESPQNAILQWLVQKLAWTYFLLFGSNSS